MLPCIDCITLGICRALYKKYDASFVSWKMTGRCSILKSYITYEGEENSFLYIEEKRLEFHNFFREEWDG